MRLEPLLSHVVNASDPRIRFREVRERIGLSVDELARQVGVSSSIVWDIEACEGELTSCYSPKHIQKFCRALNIRPIELFGDEISEPAISAEDLVRLIHDECRSRDITLAQFEDVVGWRLGECIEPPEHLLEDMTVDGLQWLCQELRIDWRRALLGL